MGLEGRGAFSLRVLTNRKHLRAINHRVSPGRCLTKTIVESEVRQELVTAYRYSELRLCATRTCVRIESDCAAYRIFGGEYRDTFDRTWQFSIWEAQLKMGTVDRDLQVG